MAMTAEGFRAAFPVESEHVEFKEGLSTKELRRAIVAFSNTDGGVIVLGVLDDASVHGFTLTSKGSAQLNNDVFGEVINPGSYEVRHVPVDGKTVVVISVAKRREGFAQLPDGGVLGRFGASNRVLLGEDLARLVHRGALGRFETTPTAVAAEHAAPELLSRLASAWGWQPGHAVDRMIEHGLAVVTAGEPVLTVAGALHLLDAPHEVLGKTYIEIFRYRYDETTPDRRVEVMGPLAHQIEEAASNVMDEIGADYVVIGTQRHDLLRLPLEVLREAIANAVAHRSYEANGTAVRIELRSDRVVVTSPGGLPEPVTVANIREQYAARNLAVIATLRRYGLAEDAGRGVDIMQDLMAEHLLAPPEFADTGTSVSVTLWTVGIVTPRERAWLAELEQRSSLGAADRLLLVHAARGVELTNARARDILGVDSVEARQILQRLRDARLLRQLGQRGGATYVVSEGLNAPASTRLSDDELDTRVIDLARQGPVTNAMLRHEFGIDRVAALKLLSRLVQQRRLVRHGLRRGTRYALPDDHA